MDGWCPRLSTWMTDGDAALEGRKEERKKEKSRREALLYFCHVVQGYMESSRITGILKQQFPYLDVKTGYSVI